MKYIILLLLVTLNFSCSSTKNNFNKTTEKQQINTVLDDWHSAASEANFDAYFSKMTDDSIFIGTDATENWDYEAFKAFSKPYFDKGKAWSFQALERNIFFNKAGDLAWFDELLDTQMELCRGSGVLVKTNNGWRIKHYVLSIAIPNENVEQVVKDKKAIDLDIKSKL